MLNEKTLELMKEITQVIGVSGNEKNISQLLQKYYKKYTDEVVFDNLGSVFAVKRSKKENAKRVMICSHMDEIGYIVKEVTKNGLIKVLPLGSASKQTLLAQRIRLINGDGNEYKGSIVSSVSDEDKSKVVELSKMLVDIGASSKEEVESLGIRVGDSVVVDGSFEVLAAGKRILSKGWDGRFGCVMGIELLEEIKDLELDVDLYIGCTVQEEVGLRGSQTATNLIRPDLGIVMDCLAANDVNGDKDAVGKLGEGVLINYYDKSMMPNRALLNHLVSICKEKDIKHQYYYSMGDSDAGWIHKLLSGCPTLQTCICARNVNTNSAMIDANDYLSAKEAIVEVVKSITIEKIEAFKVENR